MLSSIWIGPASVVLRFSGVRVRSVRLGVARCDSTLFRPVGTADLGETW